MCIFVSNKAKLLSIAVAKVNNFNDVRGKKAVIKIRVFMWYEYIEPVHCKIVVMVTTHLMFYINVFP